MVMVFTFNLLAKIQVFLMTHTVKNTMLFPAISLLLLALVGCGSDGDSENLANAVALEVQRQKGTIIESVTIKGGQYRLTADQTHQLTATGIDSNNDTRDVTGELIWTSSDPAIAKIDSKGLVTAIANSDVNQGKVKITGTTINGIASETDISVSDVKPSLITLKQLSPESGNINTCIAASVVGDVIYEDGFTSLNTVNNIEFSLNNNTTAEIDNNGNLYTQSEFTESIEITGKIDTLSANLTVIADPSNLASIDILLDDEITSIFEFNVGDRIQVNAQANLLPEISEEAVNIDQSTTWQQNDENYLGITNHGDEKGTLLALKSGVTELTANCGGKVGSATIAIKGGSHLQNVKINDDEGTLLLEKNGTLALTLTASYSSDPTSLNVTEFATWSINGSPLVTSELTDTGTNEATYVLTALEDKTGELIVSTIYDGITASVIITIE